MRPTYIPGRPRWNQVLAGAGVATTLLVAASPFSPKAAAAVLSAPVPASATPTVSPSASVRATNPAARTTAASSRATTPTAAGKNTPALSIGVTDGTNTAKPGDLLSYTVNIRNLGSANAPPLEVALMLPPAFKLLSASGDGAKAAGQVKWRVSLPAGHSGAFRVVGRVGDTPRQLLRLDAIACATTAKGAKPIVCAAASNELPAGAAAAAHAQLAAAPSAHHLIWYALVIVAAVVLLVLLAGVALMARRRLTTNKGARSSQ